MKKYHVYGVGNALVDKEFEVDDQFMIDNGIEKGMMTLVSHEQQQQLLDNLINSSGLKKKAGGGSAANTLYAMSQFGSKAFFSCKVANDDTGDFYLAELGTQNIETNTLSQRDTGTTGRCLVMISPDAERTMHTYLGISEQVSIKEIDLDAAKNSEYIYIEGYLVTSDSARAAVIELKQFAQDNNVKTAMTFSDPAMVEYFKDGINEVYGTGVDLLFCNEKEALLFTGTDTLEDACAALKATAKQFAITLGPNGAYLFDGEKSYDIAPNKVDAIDTNGAGDMFAGAFLYALTAGHDFETAGKLASLASSRVVSQFGPRLEAAEHQLILKQIIA